MPKGLLCKAYLNVQYNHGYRRPFLHAFLFTLGGVKHIVSELDVDFVVSAGKACVYISEAELIENNTAEIGKQF
jgi:hypothetical protein